MKKYLGIDIGGTGIKSAVVDVETGEIVSDRVQIKTPEDKTINGLTKVISDLVKMHSWTEKGIGICFPSVIRNEIALTANNISPAWIGINIKEAFEQILKVPISILNDADAVGVAELAFGAAKQTHGKVVVITLGTGLGSSLIFNKQLVPNIELGEIIYNGKPLESSVSNKARLEEVMSWEEFGSKLGDVFSHLNSIIHPDLILIGGGISNRFDDYRDYLPSNIEIEPCTMRNDAGIIGASYHYYLSTVGLGLN